MWIFAVPFHSVLQGRVRRDTASIPVARADREGEAFAHPYRLVCYGCLHRRRILESGQLQLALFAMLWSFSICLSTTLSSSPWSSATIATKHHSWMSLADGFLAAKIAIFEKRAANEDHTFEA